MLGLLTTKAKDWRMAYKTKDSYSFGPVGHGWTEFILKSEAAQVAIPVKFYGFQLGLDISWGSVPDRVKNFNEQMENLPRIITDYKYWPLKCLRPFSASDVNNATGRMGLYRVSTNIVFRFHAEKWENVKSSGSSLKQQIRLFEQPAEGLPIPDQSFGIAFKGTDGHWEYSGDMTCCWDKSKF